MNVYEILTNTIVEKLEKGVIPWKKPYNGIEVAPMNFLSKKEYNGINRLLLSLTGFNSPYWLTYNQAKTYLGYKKVGRAWKWKGEGEDPKLGVQKNCTPHKILFAKTSIKKDKETGKEKAYTVWRYSTVYNLDEIKGIDCPYIKEVKDNSLKVNNSYINNCQQKIRLYSDSNIIPPIINHSKPIAFYNPGKDYIGTPDINGYHESEMYYATLFHEIIHSTGHKSRCDREFGKTMKSSAYAKEELIAEIGSFFLCNETGIASSTINNTVAYLQSWLRHLKDDPKMIITASSKAQEAMNYLNQAPKLVLAKALKEAEV